MDRNTHELINRLGEAHYDFLSQWPGYVREHMFGAALIGNRLIPIPFRSHATFVRTSRERVDILLHAVWEFCTELGAIPAFQLDPETAPDDFAVSLVASGFFKQVEEAWMVFGRQYAENVSPNPDVEVEYIKARSSDATIQAYIDCYNVSFHSPPHVQAGFAESFRGVLTQPTSIHYLGRVMGEPAGSMTLSFKDDLGCVYNVGTFPEFRGRGVAATLLLRLIEDATRLGVDTLFLQAVQKGPAQPLYERVGFRTHFLRAWYLPQAPGGIWSAPA
jgi:ribosomal protein S18 acetylase RimI-like enzyme